MFGKTNEREPVCEALLRAGFVEGVGFRVTITGDFVIHSTNPRPPKQFMTGAEVLAWLEESR